MKQENINKAYKSLTKLNEFTLPLKKAYGVYKLIKAVDDAYQFALGEEQKYLAEYHGNFTDDGTIAFATPTDCAAFKDKVDELCSIDVDVEFEPITISESDLGEQKLTPSDIFNLEGFVIFE